jgi:hypothetical protein
MADEKVEEDDWTEVEVEGGVWRCGRVHGDAHRWPGELPEVGAKRIGCGEDDEVEVRVRG